MNFNFADDGALESVLPIAVQRGLAVITREVFHKGRLREQGSHQELLAERGLYHTLYQLQYRDQEPAAAR